MPKIPSLVERNMFDFFASPRLTLLRAQRHIHDFNAEVTHFISNKPWSYVTEKNVDGTLDLHKIKFARRLPSDLPCILFDAANNLRAVLDQAGYGSAIAAGKIEPKNAYFPFGDD